MRKVLLFNPRAVSHGSPNYRIPNSILQVAASIHGMADYVIVDGNREGDSATKISTHLASGQFRYFACTVMPGPQLKEAIPITKMVRQTFPEVTNIWGGYFASNQCNVVLQSGYVDFCINGPGDKAFPALIRALENNQPYDFLKNLIYRNFDGKVIKTQKEELIDQDELPELPYDLLDRQYSISGYLKKTHLGDKTLAYHSSVGCPFKCSFCAVVPIYEARWKGKSAQKIYRDIKYLKDQYGADAIEFHDNNFFVSEKRTVEFSKLIEPEQMNWWGEGRIDTLDQYSDRSLSILRDSGCKMIFFGAESGNDDLLKQMDKGGKQNARQILQFAARMKQFDIVPEYSFVLGLPALDAKTVKKQVQKEIEFIRRIKDTNPQTEIIIYVYSPVPTEDSQLFKDITKQGFKFPEHLEDWLEPQWEKFDLRKNPLTPWLTPDIINLIRNFETVLNAYYPTSTDIKLSRFQQRFIRVMASVRYHLGFYIYPYELKALQKYWLRYRQPEWEGF
ncbi:MAG: radical SAM protein [Saprospiraceae bacterium]|nr:radical SAM protein [Saprospiraceae bacterium]